MPSELAITQIVIARTRSPGSNSTLSKDIDSGMRNAAPTPSTARAAISCPADEAKAQAADAPPNTLDWARFDKVWLA